MENFCPVSHRKQANLSSSDQSTVSVLQKESKTKTQPVETCAKPTFFPFQTTSLSPPPPFLPFHTFPSISVSVSGESNAQQKTKNRPTQLTCAFRLHADYRHRHLLRPNVCKVSASLGAAASDDDGLVHG